MLLRVPDKYCVVTGVGEGETELTAFDAALLDAGLGNYNLVKMSSIMPPGARLSDRLRQEVPPGSLLPVACGHLTCNRPGEVISAAVAAGLTGSTYGVIMEHKGFVSRARIEREIREMVEEALARRGLAPREIVVAAVEHRVERVGCVFAGIAIWC
ncbi:MAG: arginine decarboxylase, pyruvoyl-dependent [Firmicutes bacterium]|nr:arginine decarboxylase, pyruvoyl-dependent [Bacillota bacterium]